MKFRNTRNGAILDMPDSFSGKYWEPVDTPAPESKAGDAAVPEKAEVKKPAKKKPAKK